jgi:hypothetical protein
MDTLALVFAIVLTSVSVCLAYIWVIKPENEEKRRRAERAAEKLRREHREERRLKKIGNKSRATNLEVTLWTDSSPDHKV